MRNFELAVPIPGRSLVIEADDGAYVPKVLQREGLAGYEASTLACFLASIEQHPGPVLDVGANVGVFALVAEAVLGADVRAFEPVPELAALARELAERNGLSFTVEELALGAEDTEATFYLSDVTDSSNSLLEGFRPSTRSLTVPVRRLDGYCDREGVVPKVIKIDTEATEPDVLLGATGVLGRHRPYLICEALAGRSEAQLEAILEPFGYRWYQITEERPLVPRREIFGDRAYRFNNWLFAPEEPDAEFWDRMGHWREAIRACEPPSSPPPARAATSGTPAAATSPSAPAPPRPATAPPPGTQARPRSVRTRRRGVYGRKKMLAGITAGVVIGVSLGRLSMRRGPGGR
ncbi:MAG: FkbM family methyltransferase [Nitriliruptor sp.]